MKICTKAQHEYEDSLECCPECRQITNLKWYANNKERAIKRSLVRYHNNKEEILQKRKIHRLAKTPEEKQKSRNRKNKYRKERYASNIDFALGLKIRIRIKTALKEQLKHEHDIKLVTTNKLLGCSIRDLIIYLEAQFQSGMTWENNTRDGWHMDHIKPLSSFDLSDPEQLKKACHYTNLQPLWAKDNLIKNNIIL